MTITSNTLDDAEVPDQFLVMTVIPYTEEPEYREHIVDAADLPEFIQDTRNPEVAEMIVNIDTQFLANTAVDEE